MKSLEHLFAPSGYIFHFFDKTDFKQYLYNKSKLIFLFPILIFFFFILPIPATTDYAYYASDLIACT